MKKYILFLSLVYIVPLIAIEIPIDSDEETDSEYLKITALPTESFIVINEASDRLNKLKNCCIHIVEALKTLKNPRGFTNMAQSQAVDCPIKLTQNLHILNQLLKNNYKPAYGFASLLAVGRSISPEQKLTRNKVHNLRAPHTTSITNIKNHLLVELDELQLTGIKLMLKGHMIKNSSQVENLLFAKGALGGLIEWFSDNNDNNQFKKHIELFFAGLVQQQRLFITEELQNLKTDRNDTQVLNAWRENHLAQLLMPVLINK